MKVDCCHSGLVIVLTLGWVLEVSKVMSSLLFELDIAEGLSLDQFVYKEALKLELMCLEVCTTVFGEQIHERLDVFS